MIFAKIKGIVTRMIEFAYRFFYETTRSQLLSTMQATAALLLLMDLFLVGVVMRVIGLHVSWIVLWAAVVMVISAVLFATTLVAEMLKISLIVIRELFQMCKIKLATPR